LDGRRIPDLRYRRLAAGVVAGLAVGILARAAIVPDADASLVAMGFDPDRARLIDALVVAFVAAGAARVASDHGVGSVLGGLAAFALTFGGIFRAETRAAIAASGLDGRFDAAGWVETAGTLAVVAWLVVVAGELLGSHLRRALVAVGRDVEAIGVRGGEPAAGPAATRARVARPVALLAAVVLVVAAMPVFGDMVNYTPDVRMRVGAPMPPPLVGPGALAGVGANGAGGQGDPGRRPQPTLDAPAGTLATGTPWTAWRPTGTGHLVREELPAPWSGGRSTTATVTIYLPPGYDQSRGRRYPVVYEAPFGLGPLGPFLDGYFTSGVAPAEILVFVAETGGPYPDSECANSYDGRERFESFVVDTVVPFVDGHFRTIPTRAARTIYGPSQGGFCAAMLLLRHPDVFGQAIALSGYYTAGVASGQTVNAYRPFGGSQALIAAYSPFHLAPTLPAAVRHGLFLVLAGDPRQLFYGGQLTGFDATLTRAGIPHAVIDDTIPHSWRQFEQDLPAALHLVGLRQVSLGVFGAA